MFDPKEDVGGLDKVLVRIVKMILGYDRVFR